MKEVLICDDDKILCDLYAKVLETYGYNPTIARNGAEGLDIVNDSSHQFSLAIIDLLMPIKNGYEMMKSMKTDEKTQHIPIIAITGLAESQESFQKVKGYCCAIINKSEFDLSKFHDIVEQYII